MKRFSVDYSPTSGVLISCGDCQHWHSMRFTRKEAWTAAREHERRSHPGSTQATTALHHYRDTPQR